MWKGDLPKPPVGSFENCARCQKQFTVVSVFLARFLLLSTLTATFKTKYTMAANPPPGWLCHMCAKSSGADPFKTPAAPRKRKAAGEKRSVVNYEERRFPSLASICIKVRSLPLECPLWDRRSRLSRSSVTILTMSKRWETLEP